MRSPVERLEEWCDEEEVLLDSEMTQDKFLAPEIRHQRRLVDAYRQIIAEYREAEADYARTLDTYFEGAAHIAIKIVTLLADAVNPEETHDA